ncbi:MAG: hypothetical protein ABI672_05940 [Vicinamibacteria bacterium]
MSRSSLYATPIWLGYNGTDGIGIGFGFGLKGQGAVVGSIPSTGSA